MDVPARSVSICFIAVEGNDTVFQNETLYRIEVFVRCLSRDLEI